MEFSAVYIVTDLINALPGNSSVNTVPLATAVTSRSIGRCSRGMCFLLSYVRDRIRSVQGPVTCR
jgi:hypothetical protein